MKKFTFLLLLPLISFSQNIQWQWAKNVSNTITAGSNNLCAGDNGEFYLTTKNNSVSRIIKFDTGGNELWKIDLPSGSVLNGITAGNGFFYITGCFTNSVTFGNTTITSVGMNDVFAAKYTSAGNLVWAKNFGGINDDVGNGICNDVNGNIYLTGRFAGSVNFGTFQVSDTCWHQMFVSKLDLNGNVLFLKGAKCLWSTSSYSEGYRIAPDNQGNLYVVGEYSYFKLDTIECSGGGGPYAAYYLGKFDNSGNVIWFSQVLNGFINLLSDFDIDAANDIIITGNSSWTNGSQSLTQKYSSVNGQILWSKSVSGTCGWGSGGNSTGITAYNSESFVIGNTFPGYGTQNCPQNSNLFILKYAQNGNELIHDTIPNNSSNSQDIIRDSNGDYIICGNIGSVMSFGNYSVTANLFVAKFKEVIVATSIDKQEKSNSIKLYPNPGSGIYHLEMNQEGETTVTVFDLLGNPLFTRSTINTEQQIDLSRYAKGIYFMQVVNNGQKITKRLAYQ